MHLPDIAPILGVVTPLFVTLAVLLCARLVRLLG